MDAFRVNVIHARQQVFSLHTRKSLIYTETGVSIQWLQTLYALYIFLSVAVYIIVFMEVLIHQFCGLLRYGVR